MPYRKVSCAEQAFYLFRYKRKELLEEVRNMARKKGGCKGGKCGK